ncbi:unnamed protein product [Didymodactylos carnosus]|uniref:Uncharacterized protein n=1 Tax=Didymodactylos carnosus TaxID=1234261 RepID=A0A8S2HZC8_9BILA|nr:unnamed protein product [Didymodactylos carnosus]CAF3701264.1 unnamed protein product [Didymodactylos carnosus]
MSYVETLYNHSAPPPGFTNTSSAKESQLIDLLSEVIGQCKAYPHFSESRVKETNLLLKVTQIWLSSTPLSFSNNSTNDFVQNLFSDVLKLVQEIISNDDFKQKQQLQLLQLLPSPEIDNPSIICLKPSLDEGFQNKIYNQQSQLCSALSESNGLCPLEEQTNQDVSTVIDIIHEPINDNVNSSIIEIINDEGNFSLDDLASEYLQDNITDLSGQNLESHCVNTPIIIAEIIQTKETESATIPNLNDLEKHYIETDNNTNIETTLPSPQAFMSTIMKNNKTMHLDLIDEKKVSIEDILFSIRLTSNEAADNCVIWKQPSKFGQILCEPEKQCDITIVNSKQHEDINTFFNHDLYQKLSHVIQALPKHCMRQYQTPNKPVRNNDNQRRYNNQQHNHQQQQQQHNHQHPQQQRQMSSTSNNNNTNNQMERPCLNRSNEQYPKNYYQQQQRSSYIPSNNQPYYPQNQSDQYYEEHVSSSSNNRRNRNNTKPFHQANDRPNVSESTLSPSKQQKTQKQFNQELSIHKTPAIKNAHDSQSTTYNNANSNKKKGPDPSRTRIFENSNNPVDQTTPMLKVNRTQVI